MNAPICHANLLLTHRSGRLVNHLLIAVPQSSNSFLCCFRHLQCAYDMPCVSIRRPNCASRLKESNAETNLSSCVYLMDLALLCRLGLFECVVLGLLFLDLVPHAGLTQELQAVHAFIQLQLKRLLPLQSTQPYEGNSRSITHRTANMHANKMIASMMHAHLMISSWNILMACS
jgi:hypothetical protein